MALLAAIVCCVWLVASVWRHRPRDQAEPVASPARRVWARLTGLVAERAPNDAGHSQQGRPPNGFAGQFAQWEAALASIRCSVDTLSADLLGWQERLQHEAEQLQRELACQVRATHTLAARVERFQDDASRLQAATGNATRPNRQAPNRIEAGSTTSANPHLLQPRLEDVTDADVDVVLDEIVADLRLEKIEERELMLDDRERRLDRRERELAALVAQAQAMMR
jgi:hypothetical protein